MEQYISTDDISQWLSQAAEQFPEVQSVFIDVILVVDAECSLEDNDDHKARLAKVTALGPGLLSNKNQTNSAGNWIRVHGTVKY